MSRIHSLQSKAALIGIGSIIGMLFLLLFNIVLIGPAVYTVYFSREIGNAQKLIDVEIINQAITILNE